MPIPFMGFLYSCFNKFCLQTNLKPRLRTHSPPYYRQQWGPVIVNPWEGIVLEPTQLGHWTVTSRVQGEESRI